MVPMIRELIKRYPKLKGYRSFAIKDNTAVVNLVDLEKVVKDGDVVNPEYLINKGIISNINGKTPKVKILGTGALTKQITVEDCKTSKSAAEAIKKAKGSIK